MKKVNSTPKKPAPVFQIRINVMHNGAINVQGFPTRLDLAMNTMDQAKNVVVSWFIDRAKEGKLNKENALDERIVVAKPSIIKV